MLKIVVINIYCFIINNELKSLHCASHVRKTLKQIVFVLAVVLRYKFNS